MRLMTLLIAAIYGFSAQAQNCQDIESLGGKLNVLPNRELQIDGSPVETKIDKQGHETTLLGKVIQARGNSVTLGYTYTIKRNMKQQPTEISIDLTNALSSSLPNYPVPLPDAHQKVYLEYDKDGTCHVKRIIYNSIVNFDRALCKDLSKVFDELTKEEQQKCARYISDMATTVKNYQTSIRSEGLKLATTYANNPYQEALTQAAECAKSLNKKTAQDSRATRQQKRSPRNAQ